MAEGEKHDIPVDMSCLPNIRRQRLCPSYVVYKPGTSQQDAGFKFVVEETETNLATQLNTD